MKYKIRVFNKNTNKEVMSIDEVFESKDAAEAEIERLKVSISQDFQYVKIPIKKVSETFNERASKISGCTRRVFTFFC